MVLHGMMEVDCSSPSEAISCLDAGSRCRCVLPSSPNSGNGMGVTQSHGLFIVTLRQEWIEGKIYFLITFFVEGLIVSSLKRHLWRQMPRREQV